jgi:uroporphyrinogen decarboxylase
MTNRENVIRALRRDHPERVPFDMTLCPAHVENLKAKTGTADYHAYFQFPYRYVELEPSVKKIDYSSYYRNLPPTAKPLSWNPEWGVLSVPGSLAHFEEMLHPMENFEDAEEILAYPFPDYNEAYRWNGMDAKTGSLKQNDLIAIAFMQMTIFEVAWYLRGMENFMIDLIDNYEFAETLLDSIMNIRIGMAEKYAQYGIDILMLGDDVSTQLEMMIDPGLWREVIKPRLVKVIRAAKQAKPDILIFYHGDGNLQAIIPDLIEAGVDILNPVQPECMDPVIIKRQYGDRLSFWGTIGTQTTLPFGTAKDVEAVVKKNIETVGSGGGLLLAPTHMIEPEVPWENIEAFIGAIKKYGIY